MNQKRFRQIDKSEWKHGDYIECALIRYEASRFADKFEEFWEDGLGRAKAAGFVTDEGKQFSIIEYLDAPKLPETYILCYNDPERITNDIEDAMECLGLTSSELVWTHESINFQQHELWRQDDIGSKFLIDTFPCRADAMQKLKEFEKHLHKQTYWVEKKKS